MNIARCISCLSRAEDIIIVDSGSTDDTAKIAKATRSDVRIFEHPFEDFGAQRNWALDETSPKHDWVLFVDADEFCDDAFLDEVAEFLSDSRNYVGAYVAGRNYFLGRWLKYSTFFPSYQFRLVKRGEARFEKQGHGQKELMDGPHYYFEHGWRHEAFSKGVSEWIARHNWYSSEEIALMRDLQAEPLRPFSILSQVPTVRRGFLRRLSAKLPFVPVLMFFYMYVLRVGFLDGRPGLIYSSLMMAHKIHISAKMQEVRYIGSIRRDKD